MIAEPSGALVVRTGKRTGRSPTDRFIVEDETPRYTVDWGAANKPFPSEDRRSNLRGPFGNGGVEEH